MTSRADQDSWLVSVGVPVQTMALRPTQAPGSNAASPPAAPASSAPAAQPQAGSGDQVLSHDAAKQLIEVWPEQLLALKAALDGIKGTIGPALKQEQEIAAAGVKAKIDPKKTDAVAKAAAHLGHALSSEEHSRLKRGESEIQKSRVSIEDVIDRVSEAKDQLSAFLQLDLEEIHTPDEKEKMGHEVATIYDTLINFGKAVIDLVTGNLGQFAGWVIAQATAEVAGGDLIKDKIEKLVDGIEEKQNKLEDAVNKVVGELNKFRAQEIKNLNKTLGHLRTELNKRIDILKDDTKSFGDDLADIAKTHQKSAADFKPVMEVYRKISAANEMLSELAIRTAQNATLSDPKWPGLIAPLGTYDESSPVGYGLPAGWIGLAYKGATGRRVFLVTGTGGTFAASRGAGPAALEALSAAFTQWQDALAAQSRVAALTSDWGKALAGGLDSRAGPH